MKQRGTTEGNEGNEGRKQRTGEEVKYDLTPSAKTQKSSRGQFISYQWRCSRLKGACPADRGRAVWARFAGGRSDRSVGQFASGEADESERERTDRGFRLSTLGRPGKKFCRILRFRKLIRRDCRSFRCRAEGKREGGGTKKTMSGLRIRAIWCQALARSPGGACFYRLSGESGRCGGGRRQT